MSAQQPPQPAGLSQIGVNYRPQEDRMILIITLSDASQIHATMTRRFVKTLWPVLIKMLDSYEPAAGELEKKVAMQTQEAKDAIRAFQHHENIQKTKITKTRGELQKQEAKVLNREPLLLGKIAVKPGLTKDVQVLALYPMAGQGLELGLNQTLLHSLCRIIIEAHQQSEWDLHLQIPGSEQLIMGVGDKMKLN